MPSIGKMRLLLSIPAGRKSGGAIYGMFIVDCRDCTCFTLYGKVVFFRNSVKAGMEVAMRIRSLSESADGFTGRNAM